MRLTLLAALVLALAACGGGDDDEQAAAPETTAPATTAPATTEVAPPPPPHPPNAPVCESVPQPAPRASGQEKAPTKLLEPKTRYRMVVKTNCGAFTITIDQKASPKAAASFVSLARKNFFDGTFFHRIVPGFVIQGGDPSGVGTGGPGYLTVDKPSTSWVYTKGVVAMAKAATDPPGTAGSQFFVVTAEDAGLSPDYAVIGTVTGGKKVVDLIGTLGSATEAPTQPVVVDDMVVKVG
jgi:cyclophilin family peptidyl-prolyl cis-trans isomerase